MDKLAVPDVNARMADIGAVGVKAENIPLDILYEDSDIIVINKPKGMVVHPANGNPDGTLVNAIMNICKDSPLCN